MINKKQKIEKEDDSRVYAFLATFLSIIGFAIALITRKDNKYVMFYAKQSLVVFIASVVLSIFGNILVAIFLTPFSLISGGLAILSLIWIINSAVKLAIFGLWIVSWIYALSGEMKEVPIIGKFAHKLNF
jgi:uncharacterized membrane protein